MAVMRYSMVDCPHLLLTPEEELAGQKQIKALEAQRNEKRRSLFDAQDQVDKQRDTLIEQIARQMQQCVFLVPLLNIQWWLV